jgi:hypothetical protein
VLTLGCAELITVGLEHETEDGWTEPTRKQIQAPFAPPEKAILPPSTSVVGLALTVALVVPKGVSVWFPCLPDTVDGSVLVVQ